MKQDIVQRLLDERVVVIIRVSDSGDIPAIVQCVADGGLQAIEVTSNTPGWQQAISDLRRNQPDLLIGAGTITTPELAGQAIAAGAQFLVTPNTRADVVSVAHEQAVPVIMGAMTPTEVADATEAGADIIKLFPAGALGPKYLESLARGPFLGTPFFAVGGVSENNLSEWLDCGAVGVGIGGGLATPVHTVDETERLTARARHIARLLKNER